MIGILNLLVSVVAIVMAITFYAKWQNARKANANLVIKLVNQRGAENARKEKVIDWFGEVSAAVIVPHYSLQDAYEYREELESLLNE